MARVRASKQRGASAAAKPPIERARARASQPDRPWRERLAGIERERDLLRADLERAQARIQHLEQMHLEVRERIAWAMDTLQSVVEGKR